MRKLHLVLAMGMVVAAIGNVRMAWAIAGPGCLHVLRGYAPSEDAKNVIQNLLDSPGECCKKDVNQFCTVVASTGDAELYVCGCNPFCVPCHVAGSYLSSVRNTCVLNGRVQGYFSLDATSCRMLYINRRGTWGKSKPGPQALTSLLLRAENR